MTRRSFTFGWAMYFCICALCITDLAQANGSLFVPRTGPKARDLSSTFATKSQAVPAATPGKRGASSLFTSAKSHGLLASYSPAVSTAPPTTRAKRRQLVALRQLIESAESRRDGYDAVQHGATIKPSKAPTRMSIGEINTWIDDTPGQPHAIGRYQFIPTTLRRLVARLDLPPDTPFSPGIQDRLADILLAEAGLAKLHSGTLERQDFMYNLAKIWAGLPLPNGKSYYHGHAGNKASISWEVYEREMRRIFPDPAPRETRLAAAR